MKAKYMLEGDGALVFKWFNVVHHFQWEYGQLTFQISLLSLLGLLLATLPLRNNGPLSTLLPPGKFGYYTVNQVRVGGGSFNLVYCIYGEVHTVYNTLPHVAWHLYQPLAKG